MGFLGGGERETRQREQPDARESFPGERARISPASHGAPRHHPSADCKPGGGPRAASAHAACPRCLPTPPAHACPRRLPTGSRQAAEAALCHRSCSQALPSRGDPGDSRRLTQQPEDQMQLFFHRGAGEHGPPGDHLVVDAPNAPRAAAEALGLVREKPCGRPTTPRPGLRFLERETSSRSCVPSLLQVTAHPRCGERAPKTPSPRGHGKQHGLWESPPPSGVTNTVGTYGAARADRRKCPDPPSRRPRGARFGAAAHHISMGVEYSVDPSRTSGGRYHSVTTSLEYVLVGTDLALASPEDERDGHEGAAPRRTSLQCCISPRDAHLPKSASLSSPLSLMSRFWGLRSRCRIFLP